MAVKEKVSVRSITFVHDPEASSVWFSIYVDLVKAELIRRAKTHKDKKSVNEVVSWFEKKP